MRLVLMRHAKSDWSAGLSDHERPLNARGRRAAPVVAETLAARGWAPQVVWSSDAARTQETWLFMAPHLPEARVVTSPQLYLAEAETILGWVRQRAVLGETALLLAHNPGISEALGQACGVWTELRTADAALLAPDAGAPGGWRLVELIRARAVSP